MTESSAHYTLTPDHPDQVVITPDGNPEELTGLRADLVAAAVFQLAKAVEQLTALLKSRDAEIAELHEIISDLTAPSDGERMQ